jgi:hypothetical protein
MNLPRQNHSGFDELEKCSSGDRRGEGVETPQPDLDASANRQALAHSRDNHSASTLEIEIQEIRVLRQEQKFRLLGQAGSNRRVRDTPLLKKDMLRPHTAPAKLPIELERKVLVQQEVHEALDTAGGV